MNPAQDGHFKKSTISLVHFHIAGARRAKREQHRDQRLAARVSGESLAASQQLSEHPSRVKCENASLSWPHSSRHS